MSKQQQLGLWGGGEQLRVDGQDAAEVDNARFLEIMRKHAASVALSKGKVSSDDLREYAYSFGIKPTHPNAWGAVFRGKGWRVVGRTKSRLKSNHAREIREWDTGGE